MEISPHLFEFSRCASGRLYFALFVFRLAPALLLPVVYLPVGARALGTRRWLAAHATGKSLARFVRLISMRDLFRRPCAAVACSVVEGPGSVSEIRREVYLHSLPIYTARAKGSRLAHRFIRLRIMARCERAAIIGASRLEHCAGANFIHGRERREICELV